MWEIIEQESGVLIVNKQILSSPDSVQQRFVCPLVGDKIVTGTPDGTVLLWDPKVITQSHEFVSSSSKDLKGELTNEVLQRYGQKFALFKS